MSIKGEIPGARLQPTPSQLQMIDGLVEARCAKLRRELDKAKAHNSRMLEALLKLKRKADEENESNKYYFETVCGQRDRLQLELLKIKSESGWKELTKERDKYKNALAWVVFMFTAKQMRKIAAEALGWYEYAGRRPQ